MEETTIKKEISSEIELELDPIEVKNEEEIKIEQENNCQDPLAIETQLLGEVKSIKIENDYFGVVPSNSKSKAKSKKSSKAEKKVKKKKTIFACDLCHKTFNRKDHLLRHSKDVHEKACETCTICNKQTTFTDTCKLPTKLQNTNVKFVIRSFW